MPVITITNVNPLIDGDHEFDWPLTSREEHYVKTLSGVRPLELPEALANHDAAAWVALASIVLNRNGKRHEIDALWDAPPASIGFSETKQETDALPPAEAPAKKESGDG